MSDIIPSISYDQNEIINNIMKLYCVVGVTFIHFSFYNTFAFQNSIINKVISKTFSTIPNSVVHK